jgi:hypothetical protein
VFDFAQQEREGMGGHTCRMLVADEELAKGGATGPVVGVTALARRGLAARNGRPREREGKAWERKSLVRSCAACVCGKFSW